MVTLFFLVYYTMVSLQQASCASVFLTTNHIAMVATHKINWMDTSAGGSNHSDPPEFKVPSDIRLSDVLLRCNLKSLGFRAFLSVDPIDST